MRSSGERRSIADAAHGLRYLDADGGRSLPVAAAGPEETTGAFDHAACLFSTLGMVMGADVRNPVAGQVAARVYAMAGLGPDAVDVAALYDSATILAISRHCGGRAV